MSARLLTATTLLPWLLSGTVACLRADDAPKEPPKKAAAKKPTMIAGKSEVLRALPKRFGKLTGVDPVRHQVTLLVDGESLAKVWSVTPDAEMKVNGWWGRLDQFHAGDRIWAWFAINRDKQPVGILMLADELTEQDMHGSGVTIASRSADVLHVKNILGKSRSLKADLKEIARGKETATYDSLKPGEKIYVKTDGDRAVAILDRAAFELRREQQKMLLRSRWQNEGLPGTVIFLHLSGEMEVMLDHEAMRWARSLTPGAAVTLGTVKPIAAEVQQMRPWRERTQVRLVVGGFDETDLRIGQRVMLQMKPPSSEVENALLPPDLDRPRSKPERVDWFLASIYCTCSVKGDGCTGDFYTLASCNPNACAMPHYMRTVIAEKIEQGLTDKQIFEQLLKEYDPSLLLRPHLMP